MSRRYQGGILGAGFDPLKAPNAPTGVTGTAGNMQVSVAFTAPTNVGGSAISSYVAVSNPGNFSNTGASSPIVVSGLTNGTAYTFQVTALNSYGPSPISAASGSVTPTDPSWIGMFTTSAQDFGRGITVDADGNIIAVGYFNTSDYSASVMKINPSGSIVWQRSLAKSSSTDQFWGVAVDGSNNVYCTGYTQSAPVVGWIVKYNSSGSLQWQKGVSYNGDVATYGLAVDASGNSYFSGYAGAYGPAMALAYFDTNGNNVLYQQLTTGVPTYSEGGPALDGAGNYYVSGYRFDSCVGNYTMILNKFTTGGTRLWSRQYGDWGSYNSVATGVSVSGSSVVYMGGYSFSSGYSYSAHLVSYDSSGTIQWQRRLGSPSSQTYSYDNTTDASGNVYIVGRTGTSGLIAKYNSSGVLQWQRVMTSSSQIEFWSVWARGDFVYVSGQTNDGPTSLPNIFIAKLPADGSKTGTYSLNGASFTYSASSLTAETINLANSTQTFTVGTVTPTTVTTTSTDAAGTFSASVTTL